MIALAWLLACQEPFGSDRHTLEADRIAAVRVVADPAGLAAEALLVVDGRLWSDERVGLAWTWLADGEDPAAWTGLADGAGARFAWTGPALEPTLLVVASFPSGAERRAVVGVGSASPLVAIASADLDRPAARTATATIAERARWTGTPARSVAPGGSLRLEDTAPRGPDDQPTRWMGTAGTWFELDEARADWLAAELTLDDGEVVGDRPLDPGPATLVGLHPEPDRGGGWRVVDVWVDAPPQGGAWVADRWLDGAVAGTQHATLEADDAAPLGLRATEVSTADEPPIDPPPACLAGDFAPDVLVTGRCLRSELVGARVRFDAVVAP